MKRKYHVIIALAALFSSLCVTAQDKPDAMWFQFDDRFVESEFIDLENVDSMEFTKTALKRYKYMPASDKVIGLSKSYRTSGVYVFAFTYSLL